ncbi:MAG TPA: hypothetical protein EYN04_09045 [Porticoccaceae bacterium]|jgi:hypothetical protein|nr:hypothetical protein [Porticoccaceae bacterium]
MRTPKLKTVLYANTAFSTLSGLVMLVFSAWIASRVLDLPSIVYLLMGVGLLGFAAAVYYVAQTVPATMAMSRAVLWVDISWVLATPVAIILLADRLTPLGNLLLIDIALIVAALAVFEGLAIKAEASTELR